jgi:hypothetical protein
MGFGYADGVEEGPIGAAQVAEDECAFFPGQRSVTTGNLRVVYDQIVVIPPTEGNGVLGEGELLAWLGPLTHG